MNTSSETAQAIQPADCWVHKQSDYYLINGKPLVQFKTNTRQNTTTCQLEKTAHKELYTSLGTFIEACLRKQKATLANLNYCEQQIRQRITECDRMQRQKKQETTFTKKVKHTKQMRPPQQKANKTQPEKKPLY